MASPATQAAHSTITPASFRQLHVKLPREIPREHDGIKMDRPSWVRNVTDSDGWLYTHFKGFLLLHNLHMTKPMGKCMLLESINTGEVVVNKRLYRYAPWLPPPRDSESPTASNRLNRLLTRWLIDFATRVPGELRFARLDDALVEFRLPDEPYFPELLAYGFPDWKKTFSHTQKDQADLFSLYFRHYNGGSLSNLLDMYADPVIGAPVPEPFVWHVIEQLSRAVIYLHTGLTREELAAGEKRDKHSLTWKPVVHRTICADNILLHFPEEAIDGGGDPLDKCFPRIVLEGFDQANFMTDPKEWWGARALANAGRRALLPPSCWEDLHAVGDVFRRVVTVHDCARPQDIRRDHRPEVPVNEEPYRLRYNVDHDGMLEQYLSMNMELEDGQVPAYSDDLIDLLMKWELDALKDDPGARFADDDVWEHIPGIKLLLEEALPLAEKKVKEYRALGYDKLSSSSDPEDDGLNGDVSWVVPERTFERIPFSNNHGSEEHALAQLESDLTYLFGPYIPVWYSYEGVTTSKIPREANKLYAVWPTDDSPDGDSDGDDSQGKEPREESVGEHDEGSDGKPLEPQESGEVAEVSQEEDENEEEDQERRDHEQQEAKRAVTAYISNIRKRQTGPNARQKLIQVWFGSQQSPADSKRKTGSESITELEQDATDLYYERMGSSRQEMETEILDMDTVGCGCSNCVHDINTTIVETVDECNETLQDAHDAVVLSINNMSKFQGNKLTLPAFHPLLEEDLIKEPPNPVKLRSQVEYWQHNPFDPDYEEDWTPDRYYPWKKWDYTEEKTPAPSEPDDSGSDGPAPVPPKPAEEAEEEVPEEPEEEEEEKIEDEIEVTAVPSPTPPPRRSVRIAAVLAQKAKAAPPPPPAPVKGRRGRPKNRNTRKR